MSHGVDSVLQAVAGQDALAKRTPLVADAISNMIFVKYYALASATLLYFDFFITFPDEVRKIWSTRFSTATLFFVLNRYVPLVGYVFILISLFNPPWSIHSNPRCKKFAPFPGGMNTFSQGIISLVLVLRTYALYERNKWVLVLTSLAGAVNIGISAWATSAMVGNLFSFPPIVTCVPFLQVDFKDRLRFGWIATFSFDFLIFCLTIGRTCAILRERGNSNSSLVALVMRDGSLFFLVMSTVNAVNFAFFATVTNPFFASTTGTNSLIAHVVSVSLMSRLMLNLRDESYHSRQRSTRTPGTDTAMTDTHLVFTTRILGNLTADLTTASDERRELEEYYDVRGRWNNAPSTITSVYTGRSILTDTGTSTSRTGPTEYSARSRARSTSRSTSRAGSRRNDFQNTNAVASGSGLGLTTSFAFDPASSSGGWDEESPSTAVDDSHPLRNFGPLSPLSPDTYVETLEGDVKTACDEGGQDDWRGTEAGAASGLSIEMTRLDRRRNSVNNGLHREDLYHDHYRTQTHGHSQEPD